MEGAVAEQVRVGVIGTGFGRAHVRAFGAHPRAVVTAVCSADAGRARSVAAELGVPYAYGDHRALLDEAPVDAISIASPPNLHRPMAVDALEAGKHVLCEKPLAGTLSDARALVPAARRSKLVHGVDQWLRYLPSSRYARELIDEGAIGRPLSAVDSTFVNVASYYGNPDASPRKIAWFSSRDQAGGLLLAAASHTCDRLRWLFGPVQSVSGTVRTSEPEVVLPDGRVIHVDSPDAAHAIFRFTSGVVALEQIAPAAWPRTTLRLEVHGDQGALLVEWIAGEEIVKLARGSASAYAEVPIPSRLSDASESAR
jgi:predicted dehydrogenase